MRDNAATTDLLPRHLLADKRGDLRCREDLPQQNILYLPCVPHKCSGFEKWRKRRVAAQVPPLLEAAQASFVSLSLCCCFPPDLLRDDVPAASTSEPVSQQQGKRCS